jgi:hypothetical protein
MDRRPWKARRLVRATTLTCTIAVLTLAFVPAASESSTQNRLFAFVVPTNRGPLPACSPGTCTLANNVNHFVYVLNANGLKHVLQGGGRTRPEVANAFVVSSVDWSIFVDGVDTFDFTATPPPDAGEFFFWSGHWVSTVGCRRPAVQRGCESGDPSRREHRSLLYGLDARGWRAERDVRLQVHGARDAERRACRSHGKLATDRDDRLVPNSGKVSPARRSRGRAHEAGSRNRTRTCGRVCRRPSRWTTPALSWQYEKPIPAVC